MRLCVFLEAWVQLILQEGTGSRLKRKLLKCVTNWKIHHKVAVAVSQPARHVVCA